MSGQFVLDWAVMAISLFNTILTLWLGLTVLLNAERRTWGIWLTGGGLLMGTAFFISHTALLGHDLRYVSDAMNFWWRFGWLPVVASPLAWYAIMLWYGGFWDAPQASLHRRQRLWLVVATLLALTLVGLLVFANPLPSYADVATLHLVDTPSIGGIPLLIMIYSIYIVLCIGLSLDAVLRPEPSGRVMGDVARLRARPWLVAASIALLLVSLLVAWAMLWIISNARQRGLYNLYAEMAVTLAWFDLFIDALIATAILLMGQAMVSYEVFTGRTLSSHGLLRQWRSAVILAVGYGVIVGESLTTQLRPIYSLLLTAILMTLFFALFNWRSYAERQRYMTYLRPFVASQRLYEHVLTPSSSLPTDVDATTPFRALCSSVLNARVGYLVALGPLAPLVGPSLTYPDDAPVPPSVNEAVAHVRSPQTLYEPLDPARYGGAMWAVPLWSERGLIGALLLGEKRDGGLYTQEEIEIARASGERLMDTQASAELARRLMLLQRQRLAESQVLDQRSRRMLHDDVLPRLHAAMLTLSNGRVSLNGTSAEAMPLLADVHRQISNLLHDLPATTVPEITRLGLVGALRQAIDEELRDAFDDVTWQIEPEAERQAETIPTLSAEVLFYAAREAIRNAARYGRAGDAARRLHLRIAVAQRNGLEILIEDDGVGLAATGLPDGSSGQGLALHSTMMAVVGGSLATESVPGKYTRVLLTLPPATR